MQIDLNTLNPQQREAATCTDGPVLVLAGAGSGKTRTLTYRIAHMVLDKDIAPYKILAITFTNKAAQEMKERLEKLIPHKLNGMWVCTFHAFCIRVLREHAQLLGFKEHLSIYDADDQKRLLKQIHEEFRLPKELSLSYCRERISLAKNELLACDDPRILSDESPLAGQADLQRLYQEYQRRLKLANAMDFDDLLMKTVELFVKEPGLLAQYQERFQYLHVDEYQDTNKAQYELCRLMSLRYNNIMVVGDDDQSIYSWRGADIRNILEFEKDYPQAKVIYLEQNYRSSGHILAAANAVVSHNDKRRAKSLFTDAGMGDKILVYQASNEHDEGNWIASEIKKELESGTSADDIAIFYRTNAQSRVLEEMLNRAGINYKLVGGTRFFDRAEIKDAICYLRLCVNLSDELAFMRAVSTPRRGVGKTSLERLHEDAKASGLNLFEAAEQACLDSSRYSKKAREGLADFTQKIRYARQRESSLFDLVNMLITDAGLIHMYEADGSFEAESRLQNLKEFLSMVNSYEADGLGDQWAEVQPKTYRVGTDLGEIPEGSGLKELEAFVEWLSLRTELDNAYAQGHQERVLMMTIHAAKGLEFPVVFVTGLEHGLFPAQSKEGEEYEEERRLAYVAYTRAMKRLRLSHAERRMIYGSNAYFPKSPFLREIPSEHIQAAQLGSQGIKGLGWDKRGDRHATAGFGSDMYGGQVHGNTTRSSSGGARRPNMTVYPELLRQREQEERRKTGKYNQDFSPNSSASDKIFDLGDRVSHKVFGKGRVVEFKAEDKSVTVVLDKSGESKRFMLGYAPLVKIKED